MTLQEYFLTFFGIGLSPIAPGTLASLAALPLGLAILYYLGMDTLFMLIIALTIVGIFEINKYEQRTHIHDPRHIVIDEVVGMWLSLMIAYATASSLSYPYAHLLAVVLSFITFRLFDIWKPSTIGWIDKELKGGLGVMLDDLLAGIAAGALSALILVALERLHLFS